MPVELRASQALRLWHDVIFDLVKGEATDLSVRQQAVLLTVYLEPPPHTVRGLAQKLGVTKPVITRALDAMGRQGLLSRKRDPADRRNVTIQRTMRGALAVERERGAVRQPRRRARPRTGGLHRGGRGQPWGWLSVSALALRNASAPETSRSAASRRQTISAKRQVAHTRSMQPASMRNVSAAVIRTVIVSPSFGSMDAPYGASARFAPQDTPHAM